MAKKITVTIQDELHGRLMGVKDSLNISKVCQVAITEAVEVLESGRVWPVKKLKRG